MPNQNATALTSYVERARKVLQYEQRTNHLDQAIRPGGVEAFAARWAEQTSSICKDAGLDLAPIHHFMEHLEGYRRQDPMQRAVNLRAALAILNELDGQYTAPTAGTSVETNVSRPPQPANKTTSPTNQTPVGSPPLPGSTSPTNKITSEPHTSNSAEQARPAPKTPPTTKTTTTGNTVETPSTGPQPTVPRPTKTANTIHLEAGMSTGHTSLTLLTASITAIPSVGPSTATRLQHLGIRTVRDLLFYFPREHRDYSKLTKIAEVPFGEITTTMGLIWEVETKRTNGGRTRTIAKISDETGALYVSWFNQPYLQKQLKIAHGSYLVVTGVKQRFGNKVEFSVRSHEFPEQGESLTTGRLVPIYPLTEGLHAKTLLKFTKWAVDHYAPMVPEHLPWSVLSAGQLMPLPDAIAQIHYPESEEMRVAARRRLAFDELFLIQLGMQERRSRWQHEAAEGNAFKVDPSKIFIDPPGDGTRLIAPAEGRRSSLADISKNASRPPDLKAAEQDQQEQTGPTIGSTLWSMASTDQPFEATLPFRFTDAQRRVISELLGDLAQSRPMCRLLQGDVGAGKTAVAAAALLTAALNGYQGAIMAPTELLAEQHAHSISAMLEPFGIRTVLLTGTLRQRERMMGRAALENGEAAVAIGTHALIQEDVNFQKLGLVIVDEQHRFGVEQRDALRQKGYHPHMLVMTATPIPRTLALTLYGDLDVSVIDQLPPGRQKIITRWRTGAQRKDAYRTIALQVQEGRQAFIICPLIEESETLAVKAATSEYERLQREVFPNLRLGLLHGAMKAADKDQTMHRFRDHELDILVATSVIEVGIDVPNATVMVIEDADRFGLSQLHQFRGRVGRGQHQSFCYVLSADASIQAQERLEVFQEIDDGFRLADEDLRLRGPGDFVGVRQSGMPEMRIADLSDTPLINLTRTIAARLWESDPYLRKPEHSPLRERMHLFWQSFMAH
ncbi:MAG TPA: ATP-dependent DNA helicase RecG [Ktedonosporobacter sp.]|nr:ATP-dependent DNA helicase RecG [Ktedonosporobacter sp.]